MSSKNGRTVKHGHHYGRRFWVGSGRPSMLMFFRSAAALATMRPVLLWLESKLNWNWNWCCGIKKLELDLDPCAEQQERSRNCLFI